MLRRAKFFWMWFRECPRDFLVIRYGDNGWCRWLLGGVWERWNVPASRVDPVKSPVWFDRDSQDTRYGPLPNSEFLERRTYGRKRFTSKRWTGKGE